MRKIIVAHPDDEVIFLADALPGAHVICVTCGRDHVRAAEFKACIKAAGATGEIWNFNDIHGGWSEAEAKQLKCALKVAIKPGDDVITHNAQGEYGHPQHVTLNKLLQEYRPSVTTETTLTPAAIQEKYRLLSYYPSQNHIITLPEIRRWIECAASSAS